MGCFSVTVVVFLGSMKGSVFYDNTVKNPFGLEQCNNSFDS